MTKAHATETTWKYTPTRVIKAGGVEFAYRELGPRGGVPVVFLHHLTAVLDDWDPRVIDGIAAQRHVIAFDNRGVGASSGSVPHTHRARWPPTPSRSSGRSATSRSTSSASRSAAASRRWSRSQAPDLVRRVILAGTGPARRRRHREIPRSSWTARTSRPR